MRIPNPENDLFQWIDTARPEWWTNLISDEEVYVDVRRDDSLNVYYNGASIMRLWWKNGPRAKIHFEYVPLNHYGSYLPFRIDKDGNSIELEEACPVPLQNFGPESMAAIKKRIKHFNSSSSEKGLQGRYVCQNNRKNKKFGFFLDSEFVYEKSRIDLVWVDYRNRRIVFVELKTIKDSRLYVDVPEAGPSVNEQLQRYSFLAQEHTDELIHYYRSVFDIKRNLGFIPKRWSSIELNKFEIDPKPILLIGDCSQNWINKKSKEIDNRVRKAARGTVYHGLGTFEFRGLGTTSPYYHWYL